MNELQLLADWEQHIIEIYYRENLTWLRGLEPDQSQRYHYKGIHLLPRFYEVTRRCVNKYQGTFNWHALETDLYFLSDEVLYYLAHVYAYRPYLNNPLDDAHRPPGYDFTIYPNNQNVPAKRYDMHVDTTFEKLYGLWNRIATLINYFLPTPLKSFNVDFIRVIQAIPAKYHQNSGYQWLLAFQLKEFKEFNDKRKAVVHHSTTGTDFGQQHLNVEGVNAHQEMVRLMQNRFDLPNFLRENMYLASEVYIQTLDLLAEIDAQDFNLPQYEQ